MTNDFRPRATRPASAAAALLLLVAAACGPAASPSIVPSSGAGGSGAPTDAPTPTPTRVGDGISHATGAADVLLRVESGGGLVPVDFMATAAPSFTLYGDGTVVFRDPTASPPVGTGNVNLVAPFQTIRLDEEGIQAMLSDAIGRGGLGIATGPYMGQGADLPTTTFTVTAGGQTKQVSVTPLSPDMHPNDRGIVTALAGLGERLDGFASSVAGEQVYVPEAYRGILMSLDQPMGPVLDWPWPSIKPADFRADANDFVRLRTMTSAEIKALGVPGIEGGFMGLTLKSDSKLYSLSVRPLLPDETK